MNYAYKKTLNPVKPLSVKDLEIIIIKYGFRYYKPLAQTWKDAFVLKKNEKVLCILIRKNGIDFRYYENYNSGIEIINGTRIAMKGGTIYRNHFNKSKNLLTKKTQVIAKNFALGKVYDSIKKEDGRSYTLNENFSEIKDISHEKFLERYQKMKDDKDWKDICNYVRDDCGGYGGDGQWSLSPY